MIDPVVAQARVAARDKFLQELLRVLRGDEQYVAAWLGGSIARGDHDALSDVDVHIVVSDEAAATLCVRPWQLAGYTTAPRAALFARFGQPRFVYENHNNAPVGGTWTCVIYASLLTVDWVIVPRSIASRSPHTHLLFDAAGIALAPLPQLTEAQRADRALERVAFFWMMMSIIVKHLLRGHAAWVNHMLVGLEPLIAEVRSLVTNVAQPFTTRVSFVLATTVEAQIAVVRQFCETVLALSPAIVSLGGYAPSAPMSIIDELLAALPSSVERMLASDDKTAADTR